MKIVLGVVFLLVGLALLALCCWLAFRRTLPCAPKPPSPKPTPRTLPPAPRAPDRCPCGPMAGYDFVPPVVGPDGAFLGPQRPRAGAWRPDPSPHPLTEPDGPPIGWRKAWQAPAIHEQPPVA